METLGGGGEYSLKATETNMWKETGFFGEFELWQWVVIAVVIASFAVAATALMLHRRKPPVTELHPKAQPSSPTLH